MWLLYRQNGSHPYAQRSSPPQPICTSSSYDVSQERVTMCTIIMANKHVQSTEINLLVLRTKYSPIPNGSETFQLRCENGNKELLTAHALHMKLVLRQHSLAMSYCKHYCIKEQWVAMGYISYSIISSLHNYKHVVHL